MVVENIHGATGACSTAAPTPLVALAGGVAWLWKAGRTGLTWPTQSPHQPILIADTSAASVAHLLALN